MSALSLRENIGTVLAIMDLIVLLASVLTLMVVCPVEDTTVLRCEAVGEGVMECVQTSKVGVRCEPIKGLASRHGLGEVDVLNGILSVLFSVLASVQAIALAALTVTSSKRLSVPVKVPVVLALAIGTLLLAEAVHRQAENLVVWFAGRWWSLLPAALAWLATECLAVEYDRRRW